MSSEKLIRTIHSRTIGGEIVVTIYQRMVGGYVAYSVVNGKLQTPVYEDDYELICECAAEAVADISYDIDEDAQGWVPGMPKPITKFPTKRFIA